MAVVHKEGISHKEEVLFMKAMETATQEMGHELKLKRSIGFISLVVFGLVFMNPASALSYFGYTQIGSGGHSVLVFLTGTVVVFFTCLSYAKMVQMFPSSGSAYVYVSKGLNSKAGFLVGWAMLLDYALIPMFIFTLTGLYMNRNFGIFPADVWMVIFAVAVLIVNFLGLKVADLFNRSAVLIQIGFAMIFAILSAIYLAEHGIASGYSSVLYNPSSFSMSGIISTSTLAVLSFLGFDAISTVAEESKVSSKLVAKSIKMSVLIQGALLCGLAYVCSLLFPEPGLIEHPDTISYDLYMLVGGKTFTVVVIAISQFLTLMCTSTAVTAASRILYSMGRDEVLPKKVFGHLNKKFRTPTWNIIIIIGICIVGGLFLDWSTIASIASFGGMFGFALVNIAVIRYFYFIKKEKNLITNFIFPALGTASIIYVMIGTSTLCKIIAFSWIACGVVYLIIRYIYSDKFRRNIQNNVDFTVEKFDEDLTIDENAI
ncbi:Putrescine importer PuuP [compost metagenome]